MAETISVDRIYDELQALRKDVDFIKDNMVDSDMIMTPEEEKRFEASMKELEEGTTTKLADLKKELSF